MAGPRWVRLDVDYFRNPKALAAGRDGRALHLASICYTAAQLTDGAIAATALGSVLHDAGVGPRAADRLVAAGLWIPTADGYLIHDYTAMNGTRAQVDARIEAARKRKAKWMAEHSE